MLQEQILGRNSKVRLQAENREHLFDIFAVGPLIKINAEAFIAKRSLKYTVGVCFIF